MSYSNLLLIHTGNPNHIQFIVAIWEKLRVRLYQPFSRTFFVVFSHICRLEYDTTSDWLNHTVRPIRSCVLFQFTTDPHRKPKPHSIHRGYLGKTEGPFLPTILKNILCRFLPNLQIRIWHNFWLAKPYGLANQKLCLIPIYHWSKRKTQTTFNTSWEFGKTEGPYLPTILKNLLCLWPPDLQIGM